MWDTKNKTKQMNKTKQKTDSQVQETNQWLPKGNRGGWWEKEMKGRGLRRTTNFQLWNK